MLPSTFDRSYAEDVLPEKLENYMKEFEADMSINEINITEKSQLRSSIAAKWCRYDYEEKRLKEKMSEKLEQFKEEARSKLFEKKKAAVESMKITQSMINIEADKVVKQSSAYMRIKDALADQEEVIRFIAEARQIVSQFGFDIKNALEALKIERI